MATTAAGVLGIGVRRFWETYPNTIAVSDAAVTLELLPALAGGHLPGDAEAWHRLYS